MLEEESPKAVGQATGRRPWEELVLQFVSEGVWGQNSLCLGTSVISSSTDWMRPTRNRECDLLVYMLITATEHPQDDI